MDKDNNRRSNVHNDGDNLVSQSGVTGVRNMVTKFANTIDIIAKSCEQFSKRD